MGHLPQDDYPVLNTFKFVSIWLHFVLDQSQTSMISLFKRLNIRGELLDISIFSKASKNRDTKIFHDLWYDLKKEVIKQSKSQPYELQLFPLDSTIVTLTSKLLWSQAINQVKLFSGINLVTGSPGGLLIHFGQGHAHKYGDRTIEDTPLNGVGVMDRRFFSLSKIAQLKQMNDRYFVLRIKKNVSPKMLQNNFF